MKKLLNLVTLIGTILIVSSCSKDDDAIFDGVHCSGNCYILSGQLIDLASNKGIVGGVLKFYFVDIRGTFNSTLST
jgi:hypothetical protein